MILMSLLKKVSAIEVESLRTESSPSGKRDDLGIVAQVNLAGRRHTLMCAFKSNSQPRHVRVAALELRERIRKVGKNAIPVLIAPYLSEDARAICLEHNIAYLDFEGNCHLAFDSVYVDREVPTKPSVERRNFTSLFSRKSAQVLRCLLRDPHQQWRITDLSEESAVSIGHVSNVRKALIDKEWADIGNDGLYVTNYDALLDAWRDAYEPPIGERKGFYTIYHGASFDDATRKLFSNAADVSMRLLLASFSAARWQAPYAKTGSQYFYADHRGLAQLQEQLKLEPTAKGENVIVTVLNDDDFFLDSDRPTPDIICTSPVQTYLDLAASGERGREAAEHLRKEKLTWPI